MDQNFTSPRTREELEKIEAAVLAPYAMKNVMSAGRAHVEKEDPFRLAFQRDRDRIIYSKAFRRLQAKTQVVVAYFGDHYRDRMTHSIEVSLIARNISRSLGLNEDLSECLSLAHDLGHPPFGHGGEAALNEIMQQFGSHFEHNEQSRRIIEKLEKIYPDFDGLNISKEVLDGLLKHNPHRYQTSIGFEISPHLEAQVMDLADEIAYTSHDIDDGIRSGLIRIEELADFHLWQQAEKIIREEYQAAMLDKDDESRERFRYRMIGKLISQIIKDLRDTTANNLQQKSIDSIEKVRACKEKLVNFSVAMRSDLKELRAYLMSRFYLNHKVAEKIEQGKNILKNLFKYYIDQPRRLPPPFFAQIQSGLAPEIVIKDYIAGMTDHYAEEQQLAIKN